MCLLVMYLNFDWLMKNCKYRSLAHIYCLQFFTSYFPSPFQQYCLQFFTSYFPSPFQQVLNSICRFTFSHAKKNWIICLHHVTCHLVPLLWPSLMEIKILNYQCHICIQDLQVELSKNCQLNLIRF